jgi:hypothetical protein
VKGGCPRFYLSAEFVPKWFAFGLDLPVEKPVFYGRREVPNDRLRLTNIRIDIHFSVHCNRPTSIKGGIRFCSLNKECRHSQHDYYGFYFSFSFSISPLLALTVDSLILRRMQN